MLLLLDLVTGRCGDACSGEKRVVERTPPPPPPALLQRAHGDGTDGLVWQPCAECRRTFTWQPRGGAGSLPRRRSESPLVARSGSRCDGREASEGRPSMCAVTCPAHSVRLITCVLDDVDARDDGPSGKTMPSLFREGFTVYHGHFRRLPFFSRTARRSRQRRATREDGPVAVKTDSMSRAYVRCLPRTRPWCNYIISARQAST